MVQQLCSHVRGLTWRQFAAISRFVKQRCGINLHKGKKQLVEARLSKRMRELGLADFDQYLELIRGNSNGAEIGAMIDALSTNVTHFFREQQHFEFLRSHVLPWILSRDHNTRRIRIWSAGCSSGEEPYSIAMCLRNELHNFNEWDLRVLATDLSRRVLGRARKGVYELQQMRHVPPNLFQQYFVHCRTGIDEHYRITKPLRRIVDFAHLNLMAPWPMTGPFDAIFCRNVMIYFEKPAQQDLVDRFWQILADNGVLFIGHSESLTGIKHRFRYLQPAIYQKFAS
jgi:chemotaxis protein methyltransferase CheR